MAKRISKISTWELPDIVFEPDVYNYEMITKPALSQKNLEIVIDKVNELVVVINELIVEEERDERRG